MACDQVVRCIATARMVMPRSVVRLSAGRLNFSMADQVRHSFPCFEDIGWSEGTFRIGHNCL